VLHDYFACSTTTAMARYHDSAGDIPDGMTIPQWLWDGLQGRPHETLVSRSRKRA
jgi:hemoglobin